MEEQTKKILNYKKPAFWIIITSIAACAIVIFLTKPKTSDISLENINIYWAKVLDKRPENPVIRDLTTEELSEFESQLEKAKIGSGNNGLNGLTPFYSISAHSAKLGAFRVAGFDLDGNNTAFLQKGKCYVINDASFAKYVSNICAADDIMADAKTLCGTIAKINGDTMLVKLDELYSKILSADSLYIPVRHIHSAYKPQIHDILEIKYNGEILETYPPQLGKIYSAKIVGSTAPPPTDLATLKKKYPQYFDLPTFKGLEVYVWQMSKDSYYCGLLLGTDREKDEEDFRKLKGITIPEMKAILSSYDIPKSDIFIIPINYAYSSYMYKIDEEYTKKVQAMFDDD